MTMAASAPHLSTQWHVLGSSETNVATKLHRVKQRLRQRLESLA